LYARVAGFENRDVTMTDELVGRVRSLVGNGGAVPGAGRHMLLLAPANAGALTLTFFGDEVELREADSALDALDAALPEIARGRRTSVRHWEVALDDVRPDCSAARVAALAGAPWRVDELVYLVRDQLATEAEELDGWRGALVLVDRGSGEARTVTFWAGDDALCRSEIREAQLRIRVAAETGASIAKVDRYAVAVDAVHAVA